MEPNVDFLADMFPLECTQQRHHQAQLFPFWQGDPLGDRQVPLDTGSTYTKDVTVPLGMKITVHTESIAALFPFEHKALTTITSNSFVFIGTRSPARDLSGTVCDVDQPSTCTWSEA